MAKKRIKPQAVTSKAEALAIIDDIARLEIARQAKDAALKEKTLELQETLGFELQQIVERITLLMDRVDGYIAAHQGELFKPGTREGETALATFGVRLGNPTVTKPGKWTWDELAGEFAGVEGLKTLTRAKVAVDKEAILKSWREATVPGRDEQGELFRRVHADYGIDVVQNDVAWVEPKADAQGMEP